MVIIEEEGWGGNEDWRRINRNSITRWSRYAKSNWVVSLKNFILLFLFSFSLFSSIFLCFFFFSFRIWFESFLQCFLKKKLSLLDPSVGIIFRWYERWLYFFVNLYLVILGFAGNHIQFDTQGKRWTEMWNNWEKRWTSSRTLCKVDDVYDREYLAKIHERISYLNVYELCIFNIKIINFKINK